MLKVEWGVTAQLNGARSTAHAVMAEQLHGPMQNLAGRLVVVKQVTSKQNEVNLELTRCRKTTMKIPYLF